MEFIDKYKKKTNLNGTTPQERLINEEKKVFEAYLKYAPTKYFLERESAYLDKSIVECTLQDSAFNDSKAYDSKVMCCRSDELVDLGDTIHWKDKQLLCVYEENNTVLSHKTFIFKICNNTLVFKNVKGEVVEYPCIVTNATLYSDGIFVNDTHIYNDDKRAILVQSNEDTKKIKTFQRFLINKNSAFKVSQIDDYTIRTIDGKNGVIQLMLIRDVVNEKLDDFTLGLADNSQLEKEVVPVIPVPEKILGEDFIVRGQYGFWHIDGECTWQVEGIGFEVSDFIMADGDTTGRELNLICKRVQDCLNKQFIIRAVEQGIVRDEKTITIKER